MIGLDWLGMVGTLTGLWLLGNRDRRAFLVSICANLCWIAWTLTSTFSLPLLLVNLSIAALNVRGWYKWAAPSAPEQWTTPTERVFAEDTLFRWGLEDRLVALSRQHGGLKNIPLPSVE